MGAAILIYFSNGIMPGKYKALMYNEYAYPVKSMPSV